MSNNEDYYDQDRYDHPNDFYENDLENDLENYSENNSENNLENNSENNSEIDSENESENESEIDSENESEIDSENQVSKSFKQIDEIFTKFLKPLYISTNIQDKKEYFRQCKIIQYEYARDFLKPKPFQIWSNLIEYLCKKTEDKFYNYNLINVINCEKLIIPGSEILETSIHRIITSFMYYGYVPGFLSTEQRIEHKITEYYFLWQKEDDPNKIVIPITLTISNDNFNKYKRWSNDQLNAYYFANILPKILQKSGLNINIHDKYNKKRLTMKSLYLKDFIKTYIKNDKLDDNDKFYNIIKLFTEYDETLDKLNNFIKNNKMQKIWYVLARALLTIKVKQIVIKQSLHKKLSNIFDKNRRFKWQNLCSKNKLNDLDIEELQELAIIEKIPYYLMMTKIELCSEFAKRFSNIIQGKKKIEPMCINTTSILGTTINEIPPEFFFSYTHNNRIYCDDIRDLHKHFEINGNKHPIDRSIMKQSVVNRINTWYDYLVNISNNMLDFDEEPVVISMISQLSSKMANLTSKMNYPKNPSLFINSNKEKFDEFLDELNKESIINSSEKITIIGLEDLNRKKLVLIDMLMLKIMNDPQQISITGQLNPLSAIAINLSNIYNKVF